jgi:hypothetical protein
LVGLQVLLVHNSIWLLSDYLLPAEELKCRFLLIFPLFSVLLDSIGIHETLFDKVDTDHADFKPFKEFQQYGEDVVWDPPSNRSEV